MENQLKVCSMFMILISTLSFVAMESAECKAKRELDTQCGKYCYKIVKPLLEHASSVFQKEKALAEIQLKANECTQTIADLQKTVAFKVELLNSKDKHLASQALLIEAKDKQLALQTELINTYKAKKDSIENEKDKKILTLESLIKEKDLKISDLEVKNTANSAKINDLQTKLAKYLKMLEQSSCKSITSIIKLPHVEPFPVSYDYKIAGPGWTVIQRRIGGTEDFNRNWEEYKTGFGDLQYDYFMGLEKIHLLTQSQPHELYIQLEDFNNEIRNARYTHFLIGSEEESYKLIKLGNFSGNSGDAFTKHLNMKFSTKDRDNDLVTNNCAIVHESGWWFHNCSHW
ncbi:angiopoietin-related protein 7-like [Drosophila hydei]|uniref:Angiopoietin-related protein 7-like n=1 Tax=Drosophila hydei TaxID=7224 RepID=A0A6J1M2G9_DROHY|nr:angiopoietin-related protein 7-like [Drosophila hydei]